MARALAQKESAALAGLIALAACARTGLRGAPDESTPAACAAVDASPSGACAPVTCNGTCVASLFAGDVTDVAADDTRVYWTANGAVTSAATCGSDVRALAACDEADMIAVDSTNVYFTTTTTISSVPKTGGSPVVLATLDAPAFGLAVSPARVYWTTRDPSTMEGSLFSVPSAGGPILTHFTGPIDAGLAVGATAVYWGSARAILEAELESTSWSTVIDNQLLGGIAVDAEYVYWTDGCGRLARSKIPFGKLELLVGGTSSCLQSKGHLIAIDGAIVAWTRVGATDGNLFWFDGMSSGQLAVGNASSSGLALAGANLFWGDHAALRGYTLK